MIPLRERRRLATVHEIKRIALRQLAHAGPAGLTLRGVARELGVAVQSLYHYFDGRDALLAALVEDCVQGLGAAVWTAVAASAGQPSSRRRAAAERAVRDWARANPAEFLLLSGTPRPESAPAPAVAAFLEVETAAGPAGGAARAAAEESAVAAYGSVHGRVLLELLGHACTTRNPEVGVDGTTSEINRFTRWTPSPRSA